MADESTKAAIIAHEKRTTMADAAPIEEKQPFVPKRGAVLFFGQEIGTFFGWDEFGDDGRVFDEFEPNERGRQLFTEFAEARITIPAPYSLVLDFFGGIFGVAHYAEAQSHEQTLTINFAALSGYPLKPFKTEQD